MTLAAFVLPISAGLLAANPGADEDANELKLTLRRQEPKTTGRHGWRILEEEVAWNASDTAIIIVDMWDRHWSWGATERVDVLAPRINTVVNAARRQGVTIIHAPSDTMEFYQKHPARKRALAVPQLEPPEPVAHEDPPLPVDASDGGSDTGEERSHKAWSRQHPVIAIHDDDFISDDGREVYRILRHRGIQNLIFMGVHTNMCVLNRSFAIKAMVRWGFRVALARDLTDAMYNPFKPPYVSHEEGTRLVIEYIEKFWCPTMLSGDLTTREGEEPRRCS